MKSRFLKPFALVLTVCMLLVCLTGCEDLDYREAVQLYNGRQYEKAAELFSGLGNYEDAPELLNYCNYWMAMDLMNAGNYEEAMPRFMKLGDFEDSAIRVKECKYQLAIEAFTEARYPDAEELFLELTDYRLTGEYLRQLNWQKLHDHIVTSGEESGGCFVLSSQVSDRTVSFIVDMTAPETIIIAANWTKDMGYVFTDDLTLTLTRDSTDAAFTASSSFTMDFHDGQIGTQQVGTGWVSLPTYTAGKILVLESFELTGTDNLGEPISSTDPAASTMKEAMVENMAAILESLPIRLAEAGAEKFY